MARQEVIPFGLSKTLLRRLMWCAERLRISRAEAIRRAIRQWCNEIERNARKAADDG